VYDAAHGVFCVDRRLLSRWVLTVDERRPQILTVSQDRPYRAVIVARAAPDSDLLLIRRRSVDAGLREEIELRNLGRRPVRARLTVEVEVDLADIFAVKHGRAAGGALTADIGSGRLRFGPAAGGGGASVEVSFTESPLLSGDGASFWVDLQPGQRWSMRASASYRGQAPVSPAEPERRFDSWHGSTAALAGGPAGLRRTFARSVTDLGSLRLFDYGGELPVTAAGAPWYMTLFGRDALLTGWSALLAGPDLAVGALETLARLQGTRSDPRTEEQPGKIVHEVRAGQGVDRPGGERTDDSSGRSYDCYYGTVDATPLFVMLLGEAHRWGMRRDRVEALLPAADAAIAWLEGLGDPDGDGYLEYTAGAGLVHQGWKDSPDGICFADGRVAEGPIAVSEAQGYAYAAYRARAELAEAFADPSTARHCRLRAARLRAAFNRDFWLPDRGWYALALDGEKRPVDALASNLGHCLWTGIIDPDRAAAVAGWLVSPDLFSGWGVRTLATTMSAYHPLSYHNGSVWPHDTAIAVAGLVRYGFIREARLLAGALLAAADAFDGRLPELFAGLDRSELPQPVSYPSSCSPQAWAAAAPLLVLRSLLRLDPDIPGGRLSVGPVLPARTTLTLRQVRLGTRRLDVAVSSEGRATVTGAGGLRLAGSADRG